MNRIFCRSLFLSLAIAGQLLNTPWSMAQTRYRICSWNVEDGPVTIDQDQDFQVVIQAIGNLDILGRSQPIDILGFQEGPEDSAEYDGIEAIFESVFGGDYESSLASADFFGCRTGFIYNTQRFQIINAASLNTGFTHNVRRVRFRPLAGSVDDDFYAYAIHLKAGTTNADADERALEASLLRSNAENLPVSLPILYFGDFNLQGSVEVAWQTLTAPGQNSSAIDSLNTPFGFRANICWNDNLAFQPFHSQNPRNNMDDRFDAILLNNQFADGAGLEHVTGSATVLGNNGSHTLGQSLDTGNGTTGFGGELAAFSDHAPVVVDLQLLTKPFRVDASIVTESILSRIVRPAGPVSGSAGSDFLTVEGSSNGSFASFAMLDFDLSNHLGKLPPATGVRNISLEIRQSNAGFSTNGPVSFYLTTPAAAAIPINSSIVYQSGQNELLCVPTVLSTGAERIATYAAVHRSNTGGVFPNGTLDQIVLFGDALEQALTNALNGDGLLRLLAVPDEAATAATWTGFTSNLGPLSLALDVTSDNGNVDVFPNQLSITIGTQVAGKLESLNASDDDRVRILSALPAKSGGPFVQAAVSGMLGTSVPQTLSLTLESRTNTPNIVQSIEIFNFATAAWEQVDSSDANLIDTTILVFVTGDPARFAGPGNLILTRISWTAVGPVTMFPWAVDLDLFKWSAGQ